MLKALWQSLTALTAKLATSDLSRLKRILETRRTSLMSTFGEVPVMLNPSCIHDIGNPPSMYDIEPMDSLVVCSSSSTTGGGTSPMLEIA